MLLEQLKTYAEERMKLPPTLYSFAPVRYIIELDGNGRLLTSRPIDTSDPANRRTRRGTPMLVPQVQRTSGVRPLLLVDKADYVLGYVELASGSQSDEQRKRRERRAAACHEAYLDLIERCAEATAEPAVDAILKFLRSDPLTKMSLDESFDGGALICFSVDGIFPTNLESVQRFWAAENALDADNKPSAVMQCLICGEPRPVLDRLQAKIKGVPGGQTSGTSIISANAAAFESYGLHGSLIAPTCAKCGEQFTLAMNDLLSGEQSHLTLGGAVTIWWTREYVEFDLLRFFTNPPEEVRALLSALLHPRHGLPRPDENAFFAAILSGSGGRTVLRDWIDSTLARAVENLVVWFSRQQIVTEFSDAPRPLGIYALAAATVREPKDVQPTTPRIFLRSALTGVPLPWNLLAETVRRCRAEQRVTRQHAALIKLVLMSHEPLTEEDTMIQLDQDHPSSAYQCGRALAILEEIQRAAMPGVNATIVDRFYGTASTAPASVFARLLRGSQPHLAKLERDRPPAYFALQSRLEEVLSHLGGFPTTLSLQEQGLFALGYYHQRAFDRAQAREAANRRDSENAAAKTADA